MDITAYILSKKYVEDSLAGVGALVGKSAYQIAVDNGFKGTEQEWLQSLIGASPTIGSNGNWFIGETDTGVLASPSLAGYSTEEWVKEQIANITFPEVDLTNYATKQDLENASVDLTGYATETYVQDQIANLELSSGVIVESLSKEEIIKILEESSGNTINIAKN